MQQQATTAMKCNPQTAEIELSTSAILQTLIDGRSENIVSDFFQRPVNRPIYRLVGPLLNTSVSKLRLVKGFDRGRTDVNPRQRL